MAAVTLTTLRARAREKADLTGSNFVADSANSLDSWINEGAQQLHEKLVEAYESEYVEKETALSLVVGQSDYTLPSDFLKLFGVDLTIQGDVRTLKPYTRAERNTFRNASQYGQLFFPRYRLVNRSLRLLPAPNAAYTGTLLYAPVLQVTKADTTVINTLVDGTDTVDFPNGWERYIVFYAAIQAGIKEETDVTKLQQEFAKMDAKLDDIIANRNAGLPMKVVDMDNVNIPRPWSLFSVDWS